MASRSSYSDRKAFLAHGFSLWILLPGLNLQVFCNILIHPTPTTIRNDQRINWICNLVHKHRELRELTSAEKKYRGLRGKGPLNTKLIHLEGQPGRGTRNCLFVITVDHPETFRTFSLELNWLSCFCMLRKIYVEDNVFSEVFEPCDLDMSLPQALKKWQALKGMSHVDFSSPSCLPSMDNSRDLTGLQTSLHRLMGDEDGESYGDMVWE